MQPRGLALVVTLLLAAPALAGCLGQSQPGLEPLSVTEPVDDAPDLVAPVNRSVPAQNASLPPPLVLPPPKVLPLLRLGDLEANGTTPLAFAGARLTAPPDGWQAACGPANCVRHVVEAEFGPGYWDRNQGGLVFTIAWGGHERVDFELYLEDAAGEEVGASWDGEYAQVVRLDRPASGPYVMVVKSTNRGGTYTGVVQVDARPAAAGEAREVAPNLVALVPKDISLHVNNYFLNDLLSGGQKSLVYEPLGLRNCGLDEFAEQQARRCLRFASAVGNLGEGPLEVRLTYPDAVLALGGEAQFFQRVYSTDGSFREVPVGKAFYHGTHRHLHYQGLATFTLHAYDLDAGARGDPVREGRKAGFCMVDEGLVRLGLPFVGPKTYGGDGCAYLNTWGPEDTPGLEDNFMGIAPGWFDMYEVDRPDQFIEVTDLPDGVYEIVAVADGDDTLVESNEDDNEASVVFRLTGDRIEVLRTFGEQGPFGAAGDGYAR